MLQSSPGVLPRISHHVRFGHARVQSNGLVRPDVCRPDSVARRAAFRDYLTRERGFIIGTEPTMRELVIIIAAFVALSAMGRGNAHFVPRPTEPLPAVNVP
jgi:hypothetical protein